MQITEETTRQIELLERIANSLESIDTKLGKLDIIEELLEEKQNRTQEAKDARELMQSICKLYIESREPINIQIGTRLHIFRLRDAICKIKNFENNKLQSRRLKKWLRILEEREFITKSNDQTYEVLDTGQYWGELA